LFSPVPFEVFGSGVYEWGIKPSKSREEAAKGVVFEAEDARDVFPNDNIGVELVADSHEVEAEV
jgi:hypothetical protein